MKRSRYGIFITFLSGSVKIRTIITKRSTQSSALHTVTEYTVSVF